MTFIILYFIMCLLWGWFCYVNVRHNEGTILWALFWSALMAIVAPISMAYGTYNLAAGNHKIIYGGNK